jgi:DNA-binding NtrC family response regulator
MKNSILIVDPDTNYRKYLLEYFTQRDFSVSAVNSEKNGMLLLNMEKFDIAIIDFCFRKKPAEAICTAIRDRFSATTLILTCSHQTPDAENKARRFSPAFYFVKPLIIEDLYAVVLRAIEVRLRKQQQVFHEMQG